MFGVVMRGSRVRRWEGACWQGYRCSRRPGRGGGARDYHGCKTSRQRVVLRRAMQIAPSSNDTPAGRHEALPLPAPYGEPSHGGHRANDPPRCAHHGGLMVTCPALAPELFWNGTRAGNASGTSRPCGGMSGTGGGRRKKGNRKQGTGNRYRLPQTASFPRKRESIVSPTEHGSPLSRG